MLTVRALVDELKELEEFFRSDLKEDQYMVLANRLIHRDCQSAIKAGKSVKVIKGDFSAQIEVQPNESE